MRTSNKVTLNGGITGVAWILGLTLALSASAGGVYKWTDAEGKVQFSDKPPADVAAEEVTPKISTDPGLAESADAIRRRAANSAEKRRQEKETAETAKTKAAEMAAHCDKVRGELANLETSTRRQTINDKGEREFIGEERRQQWMNQARAELAKNCK